MGNNEFAITFESEHLDSDVRKIVANETFARFRDSSIDHIFGGIHDRLYILGAQPGAGKSTLFLQWADELAEDGHVVLFANLRRAGSNLNQVARELNTRHRPGEIEDDLRCALDAVAQASENVSKFIADARRSI